MAIHWKSEVEMPDQARLAASHRVGRSERGRNIQKLHVAEVPQIQHLDIQRADPQWIAFLGTPECQKWIAVKLHDLHVASERFTVGLFGLCARLLRCFKTREQALIWSYRRLV